METRRWINQSQPQTMQIAVFLLYFTAVLTFLFNNNGLYPLVWDKLMSSGDSADMLSNITKLVLVVGGAAGGYGIANERRWGYRLGVVVAALPLLARLFVVFAYQVSPLRFDLVSMLFEIALFALLVHPQSRDYERIWFK